MTESQTMTLIKRMRKALIISRKKEMNTQEKINTLQKQIRKVKKELEELEKQIENLDNSSSDDNIKSTKYKITLSEFWNSEKELAIHCNTEEKAKKLLMAFDKLGKKWCDGDSYLADDCYRQDVCYDNNCEHGYYGYYKTAKYKIYEFEDVDLEN